MVIQQTFRVLPLEAVDAVDTQTTQDHMVELVELAVAHPAVAGAQARETTEHHMVVVVVVAQAEVQTQVVARAVLGIMQDQTAQTITQHQPRQ